MGNGSIPARMTITSDKVGIGTMSPGKTLDIVGTFRVSSDTFLQSHTYLPDNKHLYLGTGADSSIVQTGSVMKINNTAGNMELQIDGTTALTLADTTGNATFAGTLETTGTLTTTTIESFNGSHVQVKRNDGSNAILKIANTHTGNAMIQFDASNGDFTGNDDAYIGHLNSSHNLEIATNASSGNIVLKSKNATALTLNGANATFAGTID